MKEKKSDIYLNNSEFEVIKKVFNVQEKDVTSIKALNSGMTNRSFVFKCKDKRYIIRIPGSGTNELINRKNETHVYDVIKNKNICDNVIYINHHNGYKITEYIENSRCCNPSSDKDLVMCMKFLKKFHNLNLKVNHEFNIFEQINFYEKLLGTNGSKYADYNETKKNVFLLKNYIEKNILNKCLTHIDAVSDNFLIYKNRDGKEETILIDFEYSGMQDPHVDIAMFCIYSLYNKKQIDHLIDIYFENNCLENIRIKIYCYIAVCGLLWSNWCEYKQTLGIDFGKYSEEQYNYAKEYSKLAIKLIGGKYE